MFSGRKEVERSFTLFTIHNMQYKFTETTLF